MSHSNFKLFSIDYSEHKLNAKTKKDILSFVNDPKVLAKSVGIEFLEKETKLLVSIGYVQKKNTKTFDLVIKKAGVFVDDNSISIIEANLTKEAAKLENVICHEFFVNASNEVNAIFLVEKV